MIRRMAVKTAIREAAKQANAEIAENSAGKYGAGLASEGYAGGYRDALYDVQLLMNGVTPTRRRYWEFPVSIPKHDKHTRRKDGADPKELL